GCYRQNRTDANGTVTLPFNPKTTPMRPVYSKYDEITNGMPVDYALTYTSCSNGAGLRQSMRFAALGRGGTYLVCGINWAYDPGPSMPEMCNVPCSGNASQSCGSADYLDVWLMPNFIDYYGLG
ncbi:hypothetical protein T440DRAFT_377296, partial [Plenodomus tracheiphilus IPT5]